METETTGTTGRIYSYGASVPTVNLELVREQMHLAHKYKNKLVEFEHTRRAKVNDAIQTLFPELSELELQIQAAAAEVEKLRDAIKVRNSMARKRSATAGDKAAVSAANKLLKEVRDKRKAVKKEAFASDAWKHQQDQINAWEVSEQKRMRSECNVYWGTYLATEKSMQSARSGKPPKFRRWTGEAKLSLQIQGGLSVQAAFEGKDSRLRLTKAGKWATALFRIGSDGRKPIWCEIPFVMHRPIPDDCRIKWCYLVVRRIGTHSDWHLQFVLERNDWNPGDLSNSGKVGIDLGWRMRPTGLRVAYCIDSTGHEEELVIPHERVARWTKCEDLQSIRDTHFNGIREYVAAWVRKNDCPEWLVERAKFIGQWQSQNRAAALILFWRNNRFAADAVPLLDMNAMRSKLSIQESRYGTPVGIFDLFEAWRKKDKHLYDWQSHQRENNIKWRQNAYRNFAARVRRNYKTVKVEDCNWQQLLRVPKAEQDEDSAHSKIYARIAAVGSLRQALQATVSELEMCPTPNTTKFHFDCGSMSGQEDRAKLIHTCSTCGKAFDQDRNAALNLLNYERPVAEAKVEESLP